MASLRVLRSLLFFYVVNVLLSAGYGNGKHHGNCPTSLGCGQFGSLHFPFTKPELPHCGFLTIYGRDDPSSNKTIQMDKNIGKPLLQLANVVQHQGENLITVFDKDQHKTCENFDCKMPLPPETHPFASFHIKHNVTVSIKWNKNAPPPISPPARFIRHECHDFDLFCHDSHLPPPPPILDQAQTTLLPHDDCSLLLVPCKNVTYSPDFSSFSCGEMDVEVQVSDDCDDCYHHKGGQCQVDTHNNFLCHIGMHTHSSNETFLL